MAFCNQTWISPWRWFQTCLSSTTIDNPYLVSFLIRMHVFEWYVVWCGSKNGCQEDMCLTKKIGLHAQNMINSLVSINCFCFCFFPGRGGRDLNDQLMSTRIYTLGMKTIFVWTIEMFNSNIWAQSNLCWNFTPRKCLFLIIQASMRIWLKEFHLRCHIGWVNDPMLIATSSWPQLVIVLTI